MNKKKENISKALKEKKNHPNFYFNLVISKRRENEGSQQFGHKKIL